MKKKLIALTLALGMILAQTASAATMYALDGRTLWVPDNKIEAYRQVNWYYGKPVTMYALDDRTLTVGENDVEMYRQVGWYYGKPVTMHALDGRTLTVGTNDIEMYRQVGWYYGKPTTMYAPDGRTLTVGKNDVEMYKKVGWFETLSAAKKSLGVANMSECKYIGMTKTQIRQELGRIVDTSGAEGCVLYKFSGSDTWFYLHDHGTSYDTCSGFSKNVSAFFYDPKWSYTKSDLERLLGIRLKAGGAAIDLSVAYYGDYKGRNISFINYDGWNNWNGRIYSDNEVHIY